MIIQAVFFSLVQHKTLTHLLPPLALKYMDGTNEVNEPTQEYCIKVVLIRDVLDYRLLKITGWSEEISLFGMRICMLKKNPYLLYSLFSTYSEI